MLLPGTNKRLPKSYARWPEGTIAHKTIGKAYLQPPSARAIVLLSYPRHQNVRLTWTAYAREVRRTAAGLGAMGLAPGEPGRRLGYELRRMGHAPIRMRSLGSSEWQSFLREPDWTACDTDLEEPANIQHTSGTTNTPKAVLLTHVNSLDNTCGFPEEDTDCSEGC